MTRISFAALVALVLILPALPAEARVTMSGTLEAYNPGERKLLLRFDSGSKKNVVLTPNATFEQWGQRAAAGAFQPGMRVAIRLSGALNDDPLQADLLMDIGSSAKHVQTTASSPYYTKVGSHATTAGSGGMIEGGFRPLTGPSVIGAIGHGGNTQQVGLLNPDQPIPGQAPSNPAWPNPQIPGQGAPIQPSPAGSPFLGDALAPPSPAGLMGTTQGSSGSVTPAGGLMGLGSSDDEEEYSPAFGFGPGAPQVVQMQAQVVSVDPSRRMLAVQAVGSPQAQWVVVPAAVFVTHGATGQGMAIESLHAGQTIQVTGTSNAGGFIEARQVIAAP